MKKILIIAAAALFIGSTASAQEVMKQTGGEQNLEFLFSPLGGSPIGINGIKYRKFTSATTAYRATVFLGLGSTTTKTLGGTNNDKELKSTKSNYDISIRPGIENHWLGTDRLSPYYGGEALIGFGGKSQKDDVMYGTDNSSKTVKTSSQSSLTLGVNAFAGMDFYFADNIYLGAELGFGIAYTMDMDKKTEYINTGNGEITSGEAPGGNSFNLGPNVVGAIRLGFLF